MKDIHRVFEGGRRALLAGGLAVLVVGCVGQEEGGTSPEVAKAQEAASSAWSKEKSDHPKSERATGKGAKPAQTSGRGYINKPG